MMAYPNGYTTAGTFKTGAPATPLGSDHRTTHEALPGWIAGMEAHVGPHPTGDAQTLVYYATRNAQRSWVDNGNFEIANNGNGPFTTSNVIGIDRHPELASGTTFSTTRVALSPSVLLEGAYVHPARWHKRVVVTAGAGAGDFCYSLHRIAGVHYLSGQNATFTVWVKSGAAATCAFTISQNFGTGGAPSATVTGIGVTKANTTTAWQKLTFYVSIPSIAGKTLGTAGDDCLELKMWWDAGSTYNTETSSLGHRSETFDYALGSFRKGWLVGDYEEVSEATMVGRVNRSTIDGNPARETTGAWTTFTPSITNLTLGNGTLYGKYSRVGRTVNVFMRVVFGTTTSVGGSLLPALPLVPGSTAGQTLVRLNAMCYSTTAWTMGTFFHDGGSPVGIYSNGSVTAWNATVPATWANTYQLVIDGTYEAAV